jgi:hypothetical protein
MHEVLPTVGRLKGNNRFSFDLNKTKHKYMLLTRVSFLATVKGCGELELDGFPIQTDDYNELMRSPLSNPSLEWAELPYRQSENRLIAYSVPEITSLKSEIDYLRYPKSMDIVGYEHVNKKQSQNIECELPEFIHPDLIDTAVQIFKLSINSPDAPASTQINFMNE